MKRLLVIAVVGMLLGSTSGCRFWNCLWRGPAQQQCAPAAIAYPSPCATTCSPCDTGATVTTSTPGPVPGQ